MLLVRVKMLLHRNFNQNRLQCSKHADHQHNWPDKKSVYYGKIFSSRHQ